MNTDARYVPAFQEALTHLGRATDNLTFTYERVRGLLPLDAAGVAGLTPEDRERLDALAVRMARCQQMAGNAFKALALVEAEPQVRFIDLLALMQKRGLIESIEAWDLQRELRNQAGHIYLRADTDIAVFYNAVGEAAPAVAAYAERISRYAATLGLDP